VASLRKSPSNLFLKNWRSVFASRWMNWGTCFSDSRTSTSIQVSGFLVKNFTCTSGTQCQPLYPDREGYSCVLHMTGNWQHMWTWALLALLHSVPIHLVCLLVVPPLHLLEQDQKKLFIVMKNYGCVHEVVWCWSCEEEQKPLRKKELKRKEGNCWWYNMQKHKQQTITRCWCAFLWPL